MKSAACWVSARQGEDEKKNNERSKTDIRIISSDGLLLGPPIPTQLAPEFADGWIPAIDAGMTRVRYGCARLTG
jgi:hypothetical protein